MSVNRNDIENIILGMADIVIENRTLRRYNEELKEHNDELAKMITENARQSEQETKNVLGMILKKQMSDMEKSIKHTRCELCGGTGAELIESWQRYQVVCPTCGCATKEMKDVWSAVNAWEEGKTYAPE